MKGLNQSPWERVLRDLHREFTLLERELSLLQEIDQYILNMGVDGQQRSLEDLFIDMVGSFSRIHHTESPLLCYVSLGSEFVLLNDESQELPYPKAIQISKPFNAPEAGQDPSFIHASILSEEEDKALFSYFQGMNTILLCPMFSELKLLVCVFLIANSSTKEVSQLSDPAFGNAVVALVSQLTIAYGHHDRALQHGRLHELWNTFLQSNLSPTQCFWEIAKRIPKFLPDFGPLKFRGKGPEVQIIMLSKDPDPEVTTKELVIRGTTGEEHEGTRIAIERSICGFLIESDEGEMPFFCDDPTNPDYKELYREYLGQGKTIRTELAVRLVLNGKSVGVLNLESETPDAFNVHHINAIRRLAETIAPILMVFERRLEMNSVMQFSVASSTARYLAGIASVYRHSMETPLASLRANIELASDLVQADAMKTVERAMKLESTGNHNKLATTLEEIIKSLEQTRPTLDRLGDIQSQISNYTDDFLGDIASYADTGPTDLRATLDAAVKLANESLHLGGQLRIELGVDQTLSTTRVVGSPLLKQHLYSIFHNAVLAIQMRLLDDPTPGVISIGITKESPPESQEVLLNTFWVVSIRDNGKGVSPDQLRDLKRFYPGTRFREDRGQGFGLVAAQRYIASIGGRIELNSELGSFFEVILHFAEDRLKV